MQPIIAVFEGIDGVGKTSLLNLTAIQLKNRGSVQVFSFPSKQDSSVSEAIQHHYAQPVIDWESVAKVMFADMSNRQAAIVKSTADFVLIDRFFYSSFAYQGGFGMLPFERLQNMLNAACLFRPDLVLWCKCSRKTAKQRIVDRDGEHSSDLDLIKPEAWDRIHQAYRLAFTSKNVVKQSRIATVNTENSQLATDRALGLINHIYEQKNQKTYTQAA